ncbi:MAG: chromosome partitioning protein [Solirubrobacterales bacterium]|nr:chromosome partitioning protein [Solirubrobacterales bacterium]
MNEHNETTLVDYLAVLRRRRLFVLSVGLLCAAAALGISLLQAPSYTATSSLTVRDISQDLSAFGGAFPGPQTQLQLAAIHAPQVTRDAVVVVVKRRLHSTQTLDALRSDVDVKIDPNSIVLKVTAHARHAAEAAALANAFARADATLSTKAARAAYTAAAQKTQDRLNRLPKPSKTSFTDRAATQRASLQDQLTRLQSLSTVSKPVQVSDNARVPDSPSSPKPVRNTIAALIFGLLLGIALAYIRAALDHRLRTAADVEEALDATVVGHIRSQAMGHVGSAADGRGKNSLGVLAEPDQEAFRILRHNVRYLAAGDGLRTLVVTSAMAQEGKSTVSACLAMASAAAGKRTLLIECDLRRPVLAERFGLAEAPGLSDYLTGNAKPQDIIQSVVAAPSTEVGFDSAPAALVCITSGSASPRPADLLGSERFRAFLEEVEEVYDAIIIDSAPLLSVADTLEIIPHASGVLVCVRAQHTTRDQAQAARAALARLPKRPIGLVLTDVKDTGEGYYGYYGARPTEVSA